MLGSHVPLAGNAYARELRFQLAREIAAGDFAIEGAFTACRWVVIGGVDAAIGCHIALDFYGPFDECDNTRDRVVGDLHRDLTRHAGSPGELDIAAPGAVIRTGSKGWPVLKNNSSQGGGK